MHEQKTHTKDVKRDKAKNPGFPCTRKQCSGVLGKLLGDQNIYLGVDEKGNHTEKGAFKKTKQNVEKQPVYSWLSNDDDHNENKLTNTFTFKPNYLPTYC